MLEPNKCLIQVWPLYECTRRKFKTIRVHMGHSKHIVVVEDFEPLAETIAAYLRGENYTVSLAADGAAMRETIGQEPADLVIVDLMLPGEDGFSLARYLREH